MIIILSLCLLVSCIYSIFNRSEVGTADRQFNPLFSTSEEKIIEELKSVMQIDAMAKRAVENYTDDIEYFDYKKITKRMVKRYNKHNEKRIDTNYFNSERVEGIIKSAVEKHYNELKGDSEDDRR